jgi:probable lipoprotein NlpC
MDLSEFTNKAIGTPFKDLGRDLSGWDCWGLIVCAYKEIYDITLEDFTGLTGLNSKESRQLFEDYRNSWIELDGGKERSGDIVILRGSSVIHTGLVLGKGMMLHTENHLGTCVETYNSGLWKTKVITFCRHRGNNGLQ